MTKKRILFFAEGVTLAHVGRCISVANALNSTGKYELCLATDNRFDRVIGEIPYERMPLNTISSNYFFKRLAQGLPVYSHQVLTDYVKEDLKIIESFNPDFIFGDFRLSLAISSRIKKIPYATITNAYWSPYADLTYPVPEIPLIKWVGVNLAQKMFDLVKPIIFWQHSLAFNRVCKKFRQLPIKPDMREVYTHADFTLYADIETMLPMRPMPENHLFIGPVLWSAQVKLPDWWTSLPQTKPIVFVTLGSSGDTRLLPMILRTLSAMDLTVICVTAQKTSIKLNYANVFTADFLPAEAAVKKADLVICNGGSPMVYQSLVENKAVIGIPSNLDQYLMMSVVNNADKGRLIRSGEACPDLISKAVNQSLTQKTLTSHERPIMALDKIMTLIDSN